MGQYSAEVNKEFFDKKRLELSKKAYLEAKELLRKNYKAMEAVATALYKYEQITYEEMQKVIETLDHKAVELVRPKADNFTKDRLIKQIGIYPRDVPQKIKDEDKIR